MTSILESDELLQLIRDRITLLNERTLKVSHLPRSVKLKTLLETFKHAVNARFPVKAFRGKRKYAFVEFASCFDAKRALEKGVRTKIEGSEPRLALLSNMALDGSLPSPQTYQLTDFQLTSLNIACLPRNATEDDVIALFPNIIEIELPHAGPGKTLGFARVRFASRKDAVEAFKSKHGALIHGVPIIINFCFRKGSQSGKLMIHSTEVPQVNSKKRKLSDSNGNKLAPSKRKFAKLPDSQFNQIAS